MRVDQPAVIRPNRILFDPVKVGIGLYTVEAGLDSHRRYRIKTIFDLDQAYFSARLITRPHKEWLNP